MRSWDPLVDYVFSMGFAGVENTIDFTFILYNLAP